MKAYINKFFKYRFLLVELVKKGVRLKYRRSYLGIMWSMVEPLLTMIVLTIVFGTLLGAHEKTFPVYILSGRLFYDFYSKGSRGALSSIRKNSEMIKKVYVPKYLYPLSEVIFNYILFVISLVVLAMVAVVLGVYPTRFLVQIIVPLVLIFLLTLGSGMFLVTLGVFFSDVTYLWNIALMLIMYTCAIFYYPEKILSSGSAWILNLNPLYCIIGLFRSAIFGSTMDLYQLAYATGFSVILTIVGFVVFYRKQDEFILHL